MIILPPFPPRRAWLVSFWLVMSLAIGLDFAIVLSVLRSPAWLFAGALLAGVLAAAGVKWPQIAAFPYRAWNKLAREFSSFACFWLTGICFYVIFFFVGRAGSRLKIDRPAFANSAWIPRQTAAAGISSLQSPISDRIDTGGWIAHYARWCVRSSNLWALCLLPFVIFIAVFDTHQQQKEVPENLYTLF